MNHAFDINIAQQYGVNEAIFLNNMAFWTQRNLANKKHIHDGLCWTYNTLDAFCKIFPYWTRDQIRHLIKKLKTNGLIVSGNYNELKYDKTCWYALTIKGLNLFNELIDKDFAKLLFSTICENSQMGLVDFTHLFGITPTPIPDINTDTKKLNKKENQESIEKGSETDDPSYPQETEEEREEAHRMLDKMFGSQGGAERRRLFNKSYSSQVVDRNQLTPSKEDLGVIK